MKGEKTRLFDPEAGNRNGCCGTGVYDGWIRPLIAEFLGTTIFVLVGTMSLASADLTTIAAAHGLAILFLAVALAPISGAHLNPAVTFAVLISGFMTPCKALFYVLAQLAGGIAGAAIMLGLLDQTTYLIINGGAPLVAGTTTLGEALSLEGILTLILVIVFLVAQVEMESPMASAAHGLVYLVGVAVSFNISGGVLNIARSFGPSVIFSAETTDHWLEQWIYYVAGGIGAAVAAVIFKLFLATDDRRWKCTEPVRS